MDTRVCNNTHTLSRKSSGRAWPRSGRARSTGAGWAASRGLRLIMRGGGGDGGCEWGPHTRREWAFEVAPGARLPPPMRPQPRHAPLRMSLMSMVSSRRSIESRSAWEEGRPGARCTVASTARSRRFSKAAWAPYTRSATKRDDSNSFLIACALGVGDRGERGMLERSETETGAPHSGASSRRAAHERRPWRARGFALPPMLGHYRTDPRGASAAGPGRRRWDRTRKGADEFARAQ
jgi:hypothetical protein